MPLSVQPRPSKGICYASFPYHCWDWEWVWGWEGERVGMKCVWGGVVEAGGGVWNYQISTVHFPEHKAFYKCGRELDIVLPLKKPRSIMEQNVKFTWICKIKDFKGTSGSYFTSPLGYPFHIASTIRSTWVEKFERHFRRQTRYIPLLISVNLLN